jgi:Uma2 family endonuclease
MYTLHMAAIKTMITAEELQQIAGDRPVELVRGELVDMSPIGIRHWDLVARLWRLLDAFVLKHHLGAVGAEGGFVLSKDRDVVRAPDLAFVAAHRLGDLQRDGYFDIAPDLAVEVLSPSDRPGDLWEKIGDYFGAGTRLVWVIDPRQQHVAAHHPDGTTRIYSGDEDVPGEDVIPGFSFKPSQLFA